MMDGPQPSQAAMRLASSGVTKLENLLVERPPAGTSAAEVRAVFERHRSQLVEALAKRLETVQPERQKYPDGRWIAIPGDKVYVPTRGFGGTPASVLGVVERSRGSLRVRITGTAGIFGAATKQRTARYTTEWTVVNDPRQQEIREEQLARERAQQEQWKREQEEEEARAMRAAADAVAKGEKYLMATSRVGMRATNHFTGETGVLVEHSSVGPVIRWEGDFERTVGSPTAGTDPPYWSMITVVTPKFGG